MATQKQIAANRRNAQKSTGPRTLEGKAVTRFNALKHGIDAESCIIPGEDPEELEALAREYHDEHRPQGPTQRHLVDRLVLCDWLRRRYHRIQAEMHDQLAREEEDLAERCGEDCDNPVGAGFLRSCRSGHDAPIKLFRQINANDRTWDRALADLRRLQSEGPAPQPDPPAPQPAAPKLASFPHSTHKPQPAVNKPSNDAPPQPGSAPAVKSPPAL